MARSDPDRNLLFGVIALQTDAITRAQFLDGCALWASQRSARLPTFSRSGAGSGPFHLSIQVPKMLILTI